VSTLPHADGQLFVSDHYEERVPLAAVLDECEVVFGVAVVAQLVVVVMLTAACGVGGAAAVGQCERYSCCFHYDHVSGVLQGCQLALM